MTDYGSKTGEKRRKTAVVFTVYDPNLAVLKPF
jgi:hypothetical protein